MRTPVAGDRYYVLQSVGVFFRGVLLACLLVLLSVTLMPAQKVSAAPFECDNSFYQIINGTLARLNPDTGDYVTIGGTGGLQTNAAGYNTEDDYIYGWQRVDGFGGGVAGLLRIEHDATVTPLGIPAGMADGNYVAGDFDLSGNLYVYSGTTTLWRIDVSAMTATSVVLSATVNANDLVFVDGFLYGSNGITLSRIDPTTGTVVTAPLNLPAGTYGAGWASDNTKLFFTMNTTGIIYEISGFTGAEPQGAPVLAGETTFGNDGASCVLGRSPIPPFFATNDTNSTPVNTAVSGNVLPNDSGRQIGVTDYTQPANGTVVVNPDGSYTYTPRDDFTGVDTFTYTITDEYGETRTATVTITVTPALAETEEQEQLADSGASSVIAAGLASFSMLMGAKIAVVVRARHYSAQR